MIFRSVIAAFCLIGLPQLSFGQNVTEILEEIRENPDAIDVRDNGGCFFIKGTFRLLAQARQDVDDKEKRLEMLSAQAADNQKTITEFEADLDEVLAANKTARDIISLTRDKSRKLSERLNGSLVSAEYPDRLESVNQLRDGGPVTAEKIETMMMVMQNEIRAQRQVSRFTAKVIVGDEVVEQELIRVGIYAVFTPNGQHVLFDWDSVDQGPRLYKPLWRTKGDFRLKLKMAAEALPGDLVYIPIDPTRGRLLEVLYDRPR